MFSMILVDPYPISSHDGLNGSEAEMKSPVNSPTSMKSKADIIFRKSNISSRFAGKAKFIKETEEMI